MGRRTDTENATALTLIRFIIELGTLLSYLEHRLVMVERKRLSAQICRVLAIVELLQSSPSTMTEIAEYVNQVVPNPVTNRTIRRDVEALIAMGYCSVEESEVAANRYSIVWPTREVAAIEKVVIPKRQLQKETKFRELVAEGRTNAAIARLMKMDPRTAAAWRARYATQQKTKKRKRA